MELEGRSISKHRFPIKVPKIPVSESELEEALAFVAKTTVSYRDAWLDELRKGTMGAFVAVLLSQPLSLAHLYIDSDFFIESRFISLIFRSMLFGPRDCGLQFDLRRLKKLVIYAPYEQGYGSKKSQKIADVLPFFYLPCVKELNLTVETPVTISWPVPYPPSNSSIRELSVGNLRESSLSKVLSVTNQLEYLRWHWDYDSKSDDQVPSTLVVDLDQMSQALSYTRTTLVTMDIWGAHYSKKGRNVPRPRLSTKGCLNGLHKFEKLTMLYVPLPFVLGFNIDVTKRIEDYLPRTLEWMTISNDLCPDDRPE